MERIRLVSPFLFAFALLFAVIEVSSAQCGMGGSCGCGCGGHGVAVAPRFAGSINYAPSVRGGHVGHAAPSHGVPTYGHDRYVPHRSPGYFSHGHHGYVPQRYSHRR